MLPGPVELTMPINLVVMVVLPLFEPAECLDVGIEANQ